MFKVNNLHVKNVVRLSFIVLFINIIIVSSISIVIIIQYIKTNTASSDIINLVQYWLVFIGLDITEVGITSSIYIWKAKHDQAHQEIDKFIKQYCDKDDIDTTVLSTYIQSIYNSNISGR